VGLGLRSYLKRPHLITRMEGMENMKVLNGRKW